MNTRSSTWSVVLTFGDPRRSDRPSGADPAGFHEAACLDTVESLLAAVEPRHLVVVTDRPAVARIASAAGATVSKPGRDMTADVRSAMATWAAREPSRSGIAIVGPLPYATADTLHAALRACAATESAVIVADDGGSVALSHHDPARLAPRFGGASASRHTRDCVAVGQHIDGLQRRVQRGRHFPGRHLAALSHTGDSGTTPDAEAAQEGSA